MSNKEYTTVKFEIDTVLYKAAQASLSQINCSVEQYCVLCLLRGARCLRDIPDFDKLSSDAIIDHIVSDVVEMLVLYYINRPESFRENDVHK